MANNIQQKEQQKNVFFKGLSRFPLYPLCPNIRAKGDAASIGANNMVHFFYRKKHGFLSNFIHNY